MYVFRGLLWFFFFFAEKISLGSGPAAQAVEAIMKEMQRIESAVFMEDPMQQ
jgi:hypothetical protein